MNEEEKKQTADELKNIKQKLDSIIEKGISSNTRYNEFFQYFSNFGFEANLDVENGKLRAWKYISDARKNNKNIRVGDFVATLKDGIFKPYLSLVVEKNGDNIIIESPHQMQESRIAEITLKENKNVFDSDMILFSGEHRNNLKKAIRYLGVKEGRYNNEEGSANHHIISGMENEISEFAYDIGHKNPDIQSNENENDIILKNNKEFFSGYFDNRELYNDYEEDKKRVDKRVYFGWAPGDQFLKYSESDSLEYTKNYVKNGNYDIIDFYFDIHKDTIDCPCCYGSGKNREYKKLSDTFHDWSHQLTQDEVNALYDEGRLNEFKYETLKNVTMTWKEYKETSTYYQNATNTKRTFGKILTEEEVKAKLIEDGTLTLKNKKKDTYIVSSIRRLKNENERIPSAYFINRLTVNKETRREYRWFGHDGINSSICVKTRAKRLGLCDDCADCNGTGNIPLSHYRIGTNILVFDKKTNDYFSISTDIKTEEIQDFQNFVAEHGKNVQKELNKNANLRIMSIPKFWKDISFYDVKPEHFIEKELTYNDLDVLNIPCYFFSERELSPNDKWDNETFYMVQFLPRKARFTYSKIEGIGEEHKNGFIEKVKNTQKQHERNFYWIQKHIPEQIMNLQPEQEICETDNVVSLFGRK